VIAGLRLEGLTATAVFDEAIDAVMFGAYGDQVLVPTLRPDDVVVRDNFAVQSTGTRPLGRPLRRPARSSGSFWFRPPYSADFNPIEKGFAKLKAFLRAARPRTFAEVTTLIGLAIELFRPDECANCVRNCDYRVSVTL